MNTLALRDPQEGSEEKEGQKWATVADQAERRLPARGR